jgi:4-oxalocrotonate tautomerase
MPLIDINVIQGVFTPEEKRELVERVSETVIALEGEALRPVTHAAITETPSGEWAVGGQIYIAGRQVTANSQRSRIASRLRPQHPPRPLHRPLPVTDLSPCGRP